MSLKEIRIKRKITQEELAKITNISLSTIVRIEREQGNCTLEYAQRIAKALNCSTDEVFPITGK